MSIVVTGIGLITPLGGDRESTWERVRRGDSLVGEPDPDNAGKDWAAFVRSAKFSNPNGLHRIFPMTVAAAREALAAAGLDLSSLPADRVGCSISASKPILAPGFPDRVKGTVLDRIAPDAVGRHAARVLGLGGPLSNTIAACATGVHSIQIASRWLEEGLCDAVLAGSAESSLSDLFVSGFRNIGVLTDFPRPFDRRRKGFVMGEGAGVMVLERREDAEARRARICAEIAACAVGGDCGHPTLFAEDGSSIARVLRRALERSGLSAPDLHHVNAHGTGTWPNDRIETRALKTVLGPAAYDLSVSATKAATGHLLGASGSVEAAFACLALRDQFVPPTAHLEEFDPECDLDCTPVRGRARKMAAAASLSYGFGGPIGVVVFRR